MKEFFVVDVGNSRTKWAIADRKRIQKEHEFPTDKFTEIRGRKIPKLDLPDHPCGAIIACVVPAALPGIKACLHSLGIAHPLVVSAKLNLGVGVRYPKPGQIGADRLANAVAAVYLYGAPAIVVDFGTAVTFDVVSPNKEYLGGAIAPGLSAMTDYLYERTALLPHFSMAEPARAIGRNTVAAMRVGAVIGYRGLVREILSAICKEMKCAPSLAGRRSTPPSIRTAAKIAALQERGGVAKARNCRIHVIATGGHSALIASKIPEIHHINPQLTIEGLRILYDRNVPLE